MASLSRNSDRDAVVDFVETPFFRDYKDIMYRKSNSTKNWRLLLDIFRPTVLLCIGVALVVYTSLYLLLQLGPRERREERTCVYISNVSCYIYGALFSQGGKHLPFSASGRFLVASWWIFSIVMSATYSAKLIANLAVPRVDKPFSSTRELLENTDYKWGVVGKSSTYSLLSISKDSDIQELWKKMVIFNKTDPSVFSRSITDHIEKVLTEPYAYVMGHDKLGNGTDCKVTFLREKLFEYSKGMALPQDSPLKEDFDKVMIHLSETGFLNRLAKKWIISDGQCLVGKSAATVVTLEDMHSAFYLLLAGFGASCCILIFEWLYRMMQSYRFEKQKKDFAISSQCNPLLCY
ncbi:glutamate receptor ionotropic, kainate 2-like [Haliotis rufescens]|uniref:glutamate receptor ionotropic, kainate 2-like n=1 Tax=Haliotis rufescens TaxID=6454 RepID=UPI00201F6D90|nr:glutamate receptor ionotropic, kainate 2-like [Haliotis rufescens]